MESIPSLHGGSGLTYYFRNLIYPHPLFLSYPSDNAPHLPKQTFKVKDFVFHRMQSKLPFNQKPFSLSRAVPPNAQHSAMVSMLQNMQNMTPLLSPARNFSVSLFTLEEY